MQKTLGQYMCGPGWTPIESLRHGAGLTLSFRDAGGGGDCLFRAVAAALDEGGVGPTDFADVRKAAAAAVSTANAADVLMDMAAQFPRTAAAPMDVPAMPCAAASFSPERAWNDARGDTAAMATALRQAMLTRGNFLWGDATAAALAEMSLDINIVLLAADKIPRESTAPERRQTALAEMIFGRWVDIMVATHRGIADDERAVVSALANLDLTWDKALRLARAARGAPPARGSDDDDGGKRGWLKGRRQPVGTVRRLCSEAAGGANISLEGYSGDRPTVVIWNIANVHWVPVGVGARSRTVICKDSPLRPHVDRLLNEGAAP
jgi:hypothetical protein